MQTFDLYFESADGSLVATDFLRETVNDLPCVQAVRADDRSSALYRNEDTTVHFTIVADRPLVATGTGWDDDSEGNGAHRYEDEDDDEEDSHDLDVVEDDEEHEEEEEDEEEDEDEDEEDEDVDDAFGASVAAVHLPPLTLSVPLFRPSFFITELAAIVERILRGGRLVVFDPQADGESGAVDGSEEAILRSWMRRHAEVLPRLQNPEAIQRWTSEESRRFYGYASFRPQLAAELRGEDIAVPRIQPAHHGGRVRTLCIWDVERSTVLPRSDLILLEERREKRGLFGRRTVVESKIVPCEAVWNILGPFARFHDEPAPYLVFRRPETLPFQVSSGLEKLEGEPAENARRAELAGVVDFEIPVDSVGAS